MNEISMKKLEEALERVSATNKDDAILLRDVILSLYTSQQNLIEEIKSQKKLINYWRDRANPSPNEITLSVKDVSVSTDELFGGRKDG